MSTDVEVVKQAAEKQEVEQPQPYVRFTVGPQGRVVIPSELRRTWKLEQGETLVARLVDDQLIIERPKAILARLKQRFAHLVGGPSLVDELIAERRLEAAREDEESV